MLERISVEAHPVPDAPTTAYPGMRLGLLMNHPFNLAYQTAEDFITALQQRTKAAGFMRSLLLQRICSSFASGRSTAAKMLNRELLDDEDEAALLSEPLSHLTPTEAAIFAPLSKNCLGRKRTSKTRCDSLLPDRTSNGM